jgi:hypothetical protein
MTPMEKEAFLNAYADNVGNAPPEYVEQFVTRYESGEDMPYCEHYTSIVDALGMWHAGTRYQFLLRG